MQPGVRRVVDPYPKPNATACNLSDNSRGSGRITPVSKREHPRPGTERLLSSSHHAAPASVAAMINNVIGGHKNGIASTVQLSLRRFFFPGVSSERRNRRWCFRTASKTAATAGLPVATIFVVVCEINTNPVAQKSPKTAVEVGEGMCPMVEEPRADAGEGAL